MGPPPLPPGKDRHHIVVLEAIHVKMPEFDFPHTIDFHPRTYKGDVAERIKDATIAIACVTPVTPEDLDVAKDLRCLAIMAVGIGWLDREEFARRGVTVTNCAGGNVEAVCEHFVGLYFAIRKKIVEIDNAMKGTKEWLEKGTLIGRWPDKKPSPGCRQEVLGIFGYGTIGKRIATLAKALGFSEVLVADRKGNTKNLREGRKAFDEVVRRASTMVVCVPKSDDTVNLIDEKEFESMRSDAVVINVARGGIVNEAALASALKNGSIAGAAVDVLETEPGGIGTTPLLPDPAVAEQPIPNLIISPHIAWFTQDTIANYQQLLKEGVENWANGTLEKDGDINRTVCVHDGWFQRDKRLYKTLLDPGYMAQTCLCTSWADIAAAA